MPVKKSELTLPNELEFSGYLSRIKISLVVIFIMFCSVVIAFNNESHAMYFKWLYQHSAYPIRFALASFLFISLLIALRLAFIAFSGIPIISISGGYVSIHHLRNAKFSVMEISDVGLVFNGDYYIAVKGRKYGISPPLCNDVDNLKKNLNILMQVVSSR